MKTFNLVVVKKIKGTPGERMFVMPNIEADNVTDAVKHCKNVCGISDSDDLVVLQEDSYHQSVAEWKAKNLRQLEEEEQQELSTKLIKAA